MGLSATSSASQIIHTIRDQYQEQFAKLKAAFQEDGSIAGVESSYASDDGNVKISIRGMQTGDGRQYVNVSFKAGGAEGATLATELQDGTDPTTGLPMTAFSKQYAGDFNSNGSEIITSAEDLDATAQKFADNLLKTQAQQDAETTSWGVGDQTFTSVDDYHAYNRVEQAATDAADTIAGQMLLDTGKAPSVDFVIKLQKAMTTAMRGGGTADLAAMLKGVPEHAVKAGIKSLDEKNGDAERLIGFLQDYLAASKEDAEQRRLNLLV
jgi:hypothetical protein